MTCAHEDFDAFVAIGKITDEEGSRLVRHSVEVTVRCRACLRPLQFVGLPAGIDTHAPTVSVDGLEARLVAVPQGEELSLVDRISATFRVPPGAAH